jgi:hypothetical protein
MEYVYLAKRSQKENSIMMLTIRQEENSHEISSRIQIFYRNGHCTLDNQNVLPDHLCKKILDATETHSKDVLDCIVTNSITDVILPGPGRDRNRQSGEIDISKTILKAGLKYNGGLIIGPVIRDLLCSNHTIKDPELRKINLDLSLELSLYPMFAQSDRGPLLAKYRRLMETVKEPLDPEYIYIDGDGVKEFLGKEVFDIVLATITETL